MKQAEPTEGSAQAALFELTNYIGEDRVLSAVSRAKPFLAPPRSQERLFDCARVINAHNMASARNAYGEAAQEIVCGALALSPIPINGTFETCFDAVLGPNYYEIKSVKRGGKLVIYDCRAAKEEAAGVPLLYAILVHSIRGERADIIGAMSAAPLGLIVCRAAIVHELAAACKLQRHAEYPSPRNGYNRVGYKDGYRNLGVSEVLKVTTQERQIPNPFGGAPITFYTEDLQNGPPPDSV